jgi:hypothetical protein
MVEPLDVLSPGDLGQHDPARTRRHDRGEIGQRVRSVERIDPDPHPRALRDVGGQHVVDGLAGERLVLRRHRVFEVEQDDVGAALDRLGHLALAVARREQPGAHFQRCNGHGVMVPDGSKQARCVRRRSRAGNSGVWSAAKSCRMCNALAKCMR